MSTGTPLDRDRVAPRQPPSGGGPEIVGVLLFGTVIVVAVLWGTYNLGYTSGQQDLFISASTAWADHVWDPADHQIQVDCGLKPLASAHFRCMTTLDAGDAEELHPIECSWQCQEVVPLHQ